MNDYLKNPLWIAAAGGGLGLALWGLLAGLAQLVPAIGIMTSVVIRGTAAGFTVAPALGSIAAYATVATGGVLVVHLGVQITRKAKAEPLVWGTPIIGVLSGFLVLMCEQFWSGPKFIWLVFSVVVGLLVVIGGVLYGLKRVGYKITGALTSLLPPIAVLAALGYSKPESLWDFLRAGSVELWLPVGLLFVAAILLGVLAHVAYQREQQA